MTRKAPVRLRSNGKFWQASWRDEYGREQRRGIGSKAKLSRRDALAKCQEMAATVTVMGEAGADMTLEAWEGRQMALRGSLAETTLARYKLAHRRLQEHFGADRKLRSITPGGANDFRLWLEALPSERQPNYKKVDLLGDFSVWSILTLSKSIFADAVADERLAKNPFGLMRIAQPKKDGENVYVSAQFVEKVIEKCPGAGWKCMFGLARYAGLRAKEAMALERGHVDIENATLFVFPRESRRTTKQRSRKVPICPRLMALIVESLESMPDGESLVCWGVKTNDYAYHARKIMRLAGEDWPDPLQTLRASCATDWDETVGEFVAAKWSGHTVGVARTYYKSVKPEAVAKVTGKNNFGPQVPENARLAIVSFAENENMAVRL